MDWSRTKTIFIIVFLILDLFLIYQYIEKRNSYKFDFITETSFEDRLKENDIKYDKIPKEILNEKYLSAKSKKFVKNDLLKLKNQSIVINNDTTILSKLNSPYKVEADLNKEQLEKFVLENVLYGNEYKFSSFNKEKNTITFFQTYNGKPIFNNINGELILLLDNHKQIYGYEQTYLDSIKEFKEKEQILPAIKAIETLFNNNYLEEKSEITHIELGYYTLIQLTASQVLTPTWHIVLNGKEDVYVNAMEGQIFQTPEDKILE